MKNNKPKTLSKQVLFLATPEEHQLIKDLSSTYDISMGEVMRNLLKNYKREELNINHDERQLTLI